MAYESATGYYNFHSIARSEPQVYTAPTKEPVELSDMKDYLQVLDDEEDATLLKLIKAAREEVEADLRMAIFTQTLVLKLDCFPDDYIELRKPPVTSVSSITYLDTSGNSQTLATSQYTTDIYAKPAYVSPAYGVTWPDSYNQQNAVTVTFVAGYASQAAIPEGIKQLVRLKCAMMFEDRHGANSEASEKCYERLLTKYQWHGYS